MRASCPKSCTRCATQVHAFVFEVVFHRQTEPGYGDMPTRFPEDTEKGRCRGVRYPHVIIDPSIYCDVGLLGVQGPGTPDDSEIAREHGALAVAALSRSRRGVGARTDPARKSFDFSTSLATATTHPQTTPSPWLPTALSCSPATATPSWRNSSPTGMFTHLWTLSDAILGVEADDNFNHLCECHDCDCRAVASPASYCRVARAGTWPV
jgi:hypothetical protein